ncbi:FKBP-type peptidyl-prolyl cis-trans isomerase [Moraxella macacae 0408225]|uniref:Peptidyl-prolyl cis-trans isomerase n=1 Tax=Moraxella macacae 0408225 TaxID=1230338 RepID=L2F7G9_9GAMM|nr:FKBP-type peptidyl-prolyl cis-trans isomerase [Moraxella macacae]ELA08977.1 FKBP-type peptidyl-prolyl cis-trans isomerase [Moraxella macacae 0408225]
MTNHSQNQLQNQLQNQPLGDIVTPNEQTRITHGSRVTLHFEVSLEDGTLIDSTFGRPDPVTFVMGDGSLLEGFEKVLLNLTAGDTRSAHLSPAEAFGEGNPDNVRCFAKSDFALSGEPEIGMMIEFEDKSKSTLVGVVCEVGDEIVKVDFNHPLAGKNVLFKVKIIKVTPKDSQAVQLG